MNKAEEDKSYKFWDRVSGWSKAESAANGPLVEHLNRQFGVHILPGDTVLDFGCGTGTLTLRIARHADSVCGVDVSEGMLKRAHQNLTAQGIDNTRFLKITALEQMFPPVSFSLITTFNVQQYIENRAELFNRFYNLLTPGGRLMMAVPCFSDANSLSAFFVRFLRFVRIMPRTYFFGTAEIEKEITDAGFTIVEGTNLSDLPEKFIVAIKD